MTRGVQTMEKWVPGVGVGFLGSIGAWLLSWRVANARNDAVNTGEHRRMMDSNEAVRSDLRTLREDLRAALAELRAVSGIAAALQSSQKVVNEVTAKAVEGITDKLDRHDAMLADHAATLKLMTELLTRKEARE